MKKNIKILLISGSEKIEFETPAVINKEKHELTYIEKDELKTITKFNYKQKILTRKNKELSLIYSFDEGKETEGELTVNSINRSTYLKIKTNKIIEENNIIKIDFNVENEHLKYQIEVKP